MRGHSIRPWSVLVVVVLLACSPLEALSPKLTSDVVPTATAEPFTPSEGSRELTAEQGLAVVLEAWAWLIDLYVDPVEPLELLRTAWDGFSAALPAAQERPPFPALTGADAQADLQRFRAGYLRAAALAGGGLEGQARLAHAAVRRMTESLGDCLTTYSSPAQVQQLSAQQRGDARVGGVGIRIKRKPNEPVIIWELLEGGSAGKAGIKPGDAIVKVDGRDVGNASLDSIASLVRGQEGTQVKLTVERADGKRTQEFTLKRAPIGDQSFQTRWLAGDVAYFRLLTFNETVEADFLAALREYEARKPRGWIIDLRTNASGDYRVMQTLLSKFLKKGPFAYEVGGDGRRVALGPNGAYLPVSHPLVVLVSESTSSAAEVFAAAVQHHGAASLVGSKTAGCASIGNRLQLSDGSALTISTRKVLGPSGDAINRAGVLPAVGVEITRTELAAGKDPQLDRALAVLRPASR